MAWNISLYDKSHKLLDEIWVLSDGLEYTHTLNGIGSAIIKIPRGIEDATDENLKVYNHVEIYHVDDGLDKLVWWGLIANKTPNDYDWELDCLGYFYKLQKRIFREEKAWNGKKYNELCSLMLDYINSIDDTGIVMGISQDSATTTDRKIEEDSYFWDKLSNYLNDSGTCAEVDSDRKLNYYNENYGEDKSNYYEISKWNIIGNPGINFDATPIYNYIKGKSTYTDSNNIEHTLTCVKQDNDSIDQYGLLEYPLVLQDIALQSTLDSRTEEFLKKHSIRSVNIDISVGNCDTFNIYDINPGDYIRLNLNEDYGIDTRIRVIELTVNAKQNSAKLILGNTLYRNVPPNRRVYINSSNTGEE